MSLDLLPVTELVDLLELEIVKNGAMAPQSEKLLKILRQLDERVKEIERQVTK